jgi:extradiol dioxygenase family protein
MPEIRPFHLAFPVHDLEAAREFYGSTLQCPQGREDTHWIDYDLYGHQIVAHWDQSKTPPSPAATNAVDGDAVPVPHFGVVLTIQQFEELQQRLESTPNIDWVIKPCVRFAGQPGEQRTMFFRDPSGNALEFKAFADDSQLFAV